MIKLLRKLLCRLGRHKSLDVIQTFGAAQHVGCPDCGRRYAIHHDMRAFLPWDGGFAQLYRDMGFEIEGPLARWQAYRSARNKPSAAA